MVRTFWLVVPRPRSSTVPFGKKTGDGLSMLKLLLLFVIDAFNACHGPFKDCACIRWVVFNVHATCSCALGQPPVRPSEHCSHLGYLFGVPQPMWYNTHVPSGA